MTFPGLFPDGVLISIKRGVQGTRGDSGQTTKAAAETFKCREETGYIEKSDKGEVLLAGSRVFIESTIWTNGPDYKATYVLPLSGSKVLVKASGILDISGSVDHWEAVFN